MLSSWVSFSGAGGSWGGYGVVEADARQVRARALDGGLRRRRGRSGRPPGGARTSSGVPVAMTVPRFIATIRSQSRESSGRSCSITTIVVPSSRRMPSSSSPSASLSVWRDARRGLVEQQHPRLERRAGRRSPRPAGCRWTARRSIWLGVRREAHPLDQLVGLGGLGPVRPAARRAQRPTGGSGRPAPGDHQGLADGQRREQGGVLERADQTRRGRAPRASPQVRSAPSKTTWPRVGRGEAGDHLEQRRLAGAVGSDHAEDLAAPDLEVHAVDRDDAAEVPGEARDHERWRVRAGRRRLRLRRPARRGAAVHVQRGGRPARRLRRAPRPGRCRRGARAGRPTSREPAPGRRRARRAGARRRAASRRRARPGRAASRPTRPGSPTMSRAPMTGPAVTAETTDHGQRDDVDAGRGRERVDGERGLAVPDDDAAEAGQRAGDGVELQLAAPVRAR